MADGGRVPFGAPDTPLEEVVPNDYDPAMTRGGTVLVALTALLAAALTACSSNDAAPASTSVATTTAPTTEPPVATTEPSTTSAPTTTLDPATQLAAEVEADLLEAFDALYAAIQNPTNDDKVAAALDWHIATNREFIQNQLDDYRTNGRVARPNPDVPARVIIESPAVLVEPSADAAVVQVCEIDSWIVVEPGAGPDGSDAIVNPEINTFRSTYFMRNVDGRWRVEGGDELGTWLGLESCPPA